MKRGIYIFVIIALLIGLTSTFGCSASGEQSSVPVIKQGGKELTILSSTIVVSDYPYYSATATVKNTGSKPINYAELEMDFYDFTGKPLHCVYFSEGGEWGEREYARFVIKDLAVGEVQTLSVEFYGGEGSFKIKVNKLE